MTCPDCSSDMIPIGYGLPGPKAIEEWKKGKLILGGCEFDEASPNWHCPKCDKNFKIKKEK